MKDGKKRTSGKEAVFGKDGNGVGKEDDYCKVFGSLERAKGTGYIQRKAHRRQDSRVQT